MEGRRRSPFPGFRLVKKGVRGFWDLTGVYETLNEFAEALTSAGLLENTSISYKRTDWIFLGQKWGGKRFV
jgi:hypothetical protein